MQRGITSARSYRRPRSARALQSRRDEYAYVCSGRDARRRGRASGDGRFGPALWYGGYGHGYGYGRGHRGREVRQELRECRRELRRADSRWEYRRELRECRRELAEARRDGRYGYRYDDRRYDRYRYRW